MKRIGMAVAEVLRFMQAKAGGCGPVNGLQPGCWRRNMPGFWNVMLTDDVTIARVRDGGSEQTEGNSGKGDGSSGRQQR